MSSVTKHRKFVYGILAIFLLICLIPNLVSMQLLVLNSKQYVVLKFKENKLALKHEYYILVILFELPLDCR